MNKKWQKLFAPAFIIILGFASVSCQKCIDCEYKYTDPETNEERTYDYDEFCGTSKDVKEFKRNAQEDANEVDGELTCKKENEWFF